MRIDPKCVVFENPKDVVDYVSFGIVPKRENVIKLTDAIRYPTDSHDIRINFIPDTTNEGYADMLMRVYENFRVMQHVAIGSSVVSGILGFMVGKKFK